MTGIKLHKLLQIRGSGSKSGTMEKAKQEAHAARTLAESSYQDDRFSLPPGFLKGSQGDDDHALPSPTYMGKGILWFLLLATLQEGSVKAATVVTSKFCEKCSRRPAMHRHASPSY